jgi:hypothetical protein
MTSVADDLRELVHRMERARNKGTKTYMPAALLAVIDLAEQGKVREGVVQVADYKPAFQRLMLEVWPTQEDRWFRPMLHFKRHELWTPLLGGTPVAYEKNRFSSLDERGASKIADALRVVPLLDRALLEPSLRDLLRRKVYRVLEKDGDPRSTRLADVHAHRDTQRGDPELLRELQVWEHRHEDREAFEDLRRRQLANLVVRSGQAEFRRSLLRAYDGRCAMSDADAERALEAAHIIPFRGEHSNSTKNGLLLRGDLHTLFDDGMLTVSPAPGYTIEVHASILHTVYRRFRAAPLRLPARAEDRPDPEALDWHRRKAPPPEPSAS